MCDCTIASAVVVDGKPAFSLNRPMDANGKEKALSHLQMAHQEFKRLELRITAATVEDTLEDLKTRSGPKISAGLQMK